MAQVHHPRLPPTGLRVNSTEARQIALAWDPVLVGDVEGYAVLRSGVEGSFTAIGRTGSRFATVYTDAGRSFERLGDAATYRYRIHALDPDGKLGREYAEVSATTDPPPESPTGLRAYSNLPRRVVLAWDPNLSHDVSGYAVMRSPTLAGPWDRVAEIDGRLATVHEDPVPGDLRVLYYGLVALNEFGGESAMTEPIRAVTKAEPLPPIGLGVAARRLGAVDLVWQPNVERDLQGYRVFRAESRAASWRSERLIATPGPGETAFTDPHVGCAQQLRYRILAVDADGLESDYSKALEVTGEDLGLFTQRDSRGALLLHWNTERASAWPTARIIEVIPAFPDRTLGQVPSAGPFRLGGLAPGERRVGVTLAHPPRMGTEAPDPAPRCEVSVRIADTRP